MDVPTCAICLDNIIDATDVTKLKCKHCFHTSCFMNYIVYEYSNHKTQIKCPLCATELVKLTPQETNTTRHHVIEVQPIVSEIEESQLQQYSHCNKIFNIGAKLSCIALILYVLGTVPLFIIYDA